MLKEVVYNDRINEEYEYIRDKNGNITKIPKQKTKTDEIKEVKNETIG